MGFNAISKGALPASSDIEQIIGALSGQVDVGAMTLLGPTGTPTTALTAAVNTSAGNLDGTYGYVVTFITGSMANNGTFSVTGSTVAGPVSNSISPANQQATLSAIPVGGTGVEARGIYRNTASGSATTGPFYLVVQINNNTTTTFTDNVADASLGVEAPSTNTTGTSLGGAGGSGGFSISNPLAYAALF